MSPGETARRFQSLFKDLAQHMALKIAAFSKSMAGWWLTYPSEKYESQLG
jgi:hypothetical protein